MRKIILGENLELLQQIPNGCIDLIYIDPPFNTGKRQTLKRISVVLDKESGDRVGFGGRKYKTIRKDSMSYNDRFGDDFLDFLLPRLEEAHRVLKPNGSLFVHLDYREVHYCKVELDSIFGRENFINEIIWHYDFGARSKKKWSAKHDNILWYAKNHKNYTFNYDDIDRIPYLAPSLVGKEKAKRGKTPTSCWWHTIVPTNGKERTGYPTQKPLGIIERIVRVHSNPGDLLLDFFAGSGTFGEAAARNNRDFIMIDQNEEAVQVMSKRLSFANPECFGFTSPLTE